MIREAIDEIKDELSAMEKEAPGHTDDPLYATRVMVKVIRDHLTPRVEKEILSDFKRFLSPEEKI